MDYIKPAKILLPKSNNLDCWAVVACDQFSMNREYWHELYCYTQNKISTLNLIIPQNLLNDGYYDSQIDSIVYAMDCYIDEKKFYEINNSFVLVKRIFGNGKRKLGIVAAIDLELYNINSISSAVCNSEFTSTEGTNISFLIRKKASLELSHVVLLINDSDNIIFSGLDSYCESNDVLYDIYLNMNGGHVSGYKLPRELIIERIKRYEATQKSNFYYLIGDGNHSVSAAKQYWESIKHTLKGKEYSTHPARFMLCEIQNIFDEGVSFYPFHRFVSNAGVDLYKFLLNKVGGKSKLNIFIDGKQSTICVPEDPILAIKEIQNALEKYITNNADLHIDYINGDKELQSIIKKKGVVICMPTIDKFRLFDSISQSGILAQKSFSIGKPNEKRYYVEIRRLR